MTVRAVAPSTLKASSPVLGSFEFVAAPGLRFCVKGRSDLRFEFVLDEDGQAKEVVVESIGVLTRSQ